MEEGGLDSTWFDPLRLIHIGVLRIDLLKHLPCQVIHSLGNNKSDEIVLKCAILNKIELKAALERILRLSNPILGECK